MNTVKSEWIKLSTTKALWATSILIVFFCVGMAIIMGWAGGVTLSDPEITKDPEVAASVATMADPSQAFVGFITFGLMVIIIQAVMMVTSEYGNGSAKTTLLGTPKRTPVPIAKFLVYGSIAAVLSFVSQVVSIWAMKWSLSWNFDDASVLDKISLSAEGIWKEIGLHTLYGVACVMLSIGVGYLIRHTAGAIAALLLWKLVIEGMVIGSIPKVREWLPPYMPFGNMDAGVAGNEVPDAPWGPNGSVLYFLAWCIVFFVAGIIILKKRDA